MNFVLESLYTKGSECAYFGNAFFEFLDTDLTFMFLYKLKIGAKPIHYRIQQTAILLFIAMLLYSLNDKKIIYQRIIKYKRYISFSK